MESIADILDIPKALPILTPSGNQLTKTFAECYQKGNAFMCDVMRVEDNEDADYPTESLQEFHAYYTDPQTPQFNKDLSQRLFTAVHEIDTNQMKIAGDRRMHDEQFAKLFWAAGILPQGRRSPQSLHIAGHAGSGKTTVISYIARELAYMSALEQMKGNTVYVMDKGAHASQQLLGTDMSMRRMLRESPFELLVSDVHNFQNYIAQLIGEGEEVAACFPYAVCNELLQGNYPNPAEAKKEIIASLKRRGVFEIFKNTKGKEAMPILEVCAQILSNHAVLLKRTPFTYAAYPVIPEEVEATDERENFLTGDFGARVPRPLLDKGLLYAVKGAGLNHLLASDDTENWGEQRMGFLYRSTIQNPKAAETHLPFLKRTSALIIDEGGKIPANQWRKYVQDVRGKAGSLFVVAARAPTHNENAVPLWDARSPMSTLKQLINAGVLPSVSIDMDPNIEELRYPANSPEAQKEVIDHHFEDVPFLTARKQLQAYEGDGTFVVSQESLESFVETLEESIREHGSSARVLVYNYNTDAKNASDVQGLIASNRGYPLWVVTTPPPVNKSLSWPNNRFMTVLLPNQTRKQLKTLQDRLQHCHLHWDDKNFRTQFRIYLGTDTSYSNTALHALNPDLINKDEATTSIIPGQAVFSLEQHVKDQKIINRDPNAYPPVTFPSSAANAHLVKGVEVAPLEKTNNGGGKKPGRPSQSKEKHVNRITETPPVAPRNGKKTDVVLTNYPVQQTATVLQAPVISHPIEAVSEDATIQDILNGPYSESDKADALVRYVLREDNMALPDIVRFNTVSWKPKLLNTAKQAVRHPKTALQEVERVAMNAR